MESFQVLGVRIDNISMLDTFDSIKRAIETGRKCVITTVNIHVVMEARKNRTLFEFLSASHINTPDSSQICFLMRLRKKRFKERVTGADIFAKFPAFAAAHGITIGIFGGFGSAEKAKEKIEKERGARVVFTYSPTPEEVEHTSEALITQINEANPDVLFVALGCPKQEIWISKNIGKLKPRVFVSIGAGLDFFVGAEKRAPLWMQKMGIEWMARLFSKPEKMAKRYLRELVFYWKFLKETVAGEN
ncbi:MAG: WecB/TagA/CpsF family glycosyltransferase [Thermoplasmata archaeon]